MRNRTDEGRAFNDARRSYLFEGGNGAGRLSQLLDPDFDDDLSFDRGDIWRGVKPKPKRQLFDLIDVFGGEE